MSWTPAQLASVLMKAGAPLSGPPFPSDIVIDAGAVRIVLDSTGKFKGLEVVNADL